MDTQYVDAVNQNISMTTKTSPEPKKIKQIFYFSPVYYEAAKVVLFVSLIFSARREG